jgi:hypothetical protein
MAEHEQKQALLPNNLLTQEQTMAQAQQQAQGITGVSPINASTGQTALSALPSGNVHAAASG